MIINQIMPIKIKNTVVYRPPSLVIGVGLHQNTTVDYIAWN